jgi:rhodanese-related sulfurtransferase
VPEVELAAAGYLGIPDERARITRETLWTRVQGGDVTVVDVRPVIEYEAGHIPGAVSIPIDELPTRIARLPRGRDIVAYCRGPYCVMAPRGVDLLRAHGLPARRLEDGLPEWRLAGYPVAVGLD